MTPKGRRRGAFGLKSVLLVGIVLCLGNGPVVANPKEDRRNLEALLREILVNKTATAKVIVAQAMAQAVGGIRVNNSAVKVRRMVATDVALDGSVRYVAVFNALSMSGKESIPPNLLPESAAAGAVLQVADVEVKKDRLIIELQEVSTGDTSRLRFELPEDYASSWDSLRVLQPTTHVLEFEGLLGEVLAQTGDAYLFSQRVDVARRQYDTEASESEQRIERGVAYLGIVEAEIGRRRAWAEITGRTPDVSELTAIQTEVEREVSALVVKIHGARHDELRGEFQRIAADVAALRQSSPATEDQLAAWQALNSEWVALLAEYEDLRGGGVEEERARVEDSTTALLETRRASILGTEEEAAIAAADVAANFGATAASIAELERQIAAVERYGELVSQRWELLGRLESPAPEATQARLGADELQLERLREVIADGRLALRPALLDVQYRSLERERQKFYDAYTLAFGGPGHAKAASVLGRHIDAMIANRREAATAGNETAARQADDLVAFRRQIRSQP